MPMKIWQCFIHITFSLMLANVIGPLTGAKLKSNPYSFHMNIFGDILYLVSLLVMIAYILYIQHSV